MICLDLSGHQKKAFDAIAEDYAHLFCRVF